MTRARSAGVVQTANWAVLTKIRYSLCYTFFRGQNRTDDLSRGVQPSHTKLDRSVLLISE